MSGYTKLFGSIVGSTVWREALPTKVVWITMLAMSDEDGVVEGSIPGLAHLAGVTIEECEEALRILEGPDKYSRTPDHEGRRVEVIDGGWLILNRAKYRDKNWQDDKAERRREINHRYYQSRKLRPNSDSSGLNQSESDLLRDKKEKEKEKEIKPTTTPVLVAGDSKPKRRNRTQVLAPYSPEVGSVVNSVLNKWPKSQPKDNADIHFDVPMLAERIDGLLKQQEITAEILNKSAEMYLAERKNYYKAPQFFFGPARGETSPAWLAYARMNVHRGNHAQ